MKMKMLMVVGSAMLALRCGAEKSQAQRDAEADARSGYGHPIRTSLTAAEEAQKQAAEAQAAVIATSKYVPTPEALAAYRAEQLAKMPPTVRHWQERYDFLLRAPKSDRLDLCVAAGMVSEAWLNAGNQDEYGKWKDTERGWCPR